MELDFSKIIKDSKFRTDKEAEDKGALYFIRMFNGGPLRSLLTDLSQYLFGTHPFMTRAEEDTLELIVKSGLVENKDLAKGALNQLTNKVYSYHSPINENGFSLKKITNREGIINYKIDIHVGYFSPA